jgi:putative nucleotidyltransferase with HDIG domain
MLAQRTAPLRAFTRRDALRLSVVALIVIAGLAAILAIDILPEPVTVSAGEVATTDIRAPRGGEYVSQIQTEAKRTQAADAVPLQYTYTLEKGVALANQQALAFEERTSAADAAFDASITPEERKTLLATAIVGLSDAGTQTLIGLEPARWTAVRTEASRVLDTVVRTELRDTDVAAVRAGLAGRMGGDLSQAERELAAELISPLVVANSSYSATDTEAARAAAAADVKPVTVPVSQGEIIVRNGERVTDLQYEEIVALGLDKTHFDAARLVGWIALAILIVVPLLAWFWRFRPVLWHRTNVLLLVSLVLLFTAFALKITAGRTTLPYFLPTAAAGMIIAVLLDAWAATVLTALLAVLGGAVNNDSLAIATYIFLGGFAGILTIRRGDRLQVFLQAGLAVAAVNVLVVTTFWLLGEGSGSDVTGLLQLWGASIVSAGGAAIATVGSFAVLGNLFGILTVFQLLELANPTQALLRRLLVETPGTYHHSLMVGNLAERAAESIGADPLVARVAAFYHDVGKLANPLAFIENQAGADNVHDQLEPEVSASVLKQHVADGIDLAYRYHLPKSLIAFIPQHHGTARMSYFYAKARELAAAPFGGEDTPEGAKAADAVDERRFRHAGPKPQSREAAILMLADGVEASVRSLAARDEAAIRAMVSRIIEERVSDGQFDECDLTLRDIERIRESFVAQLLGMYHQRIAYPQNKIVELESRRAAGTGPGA